METIAEIAKGTVSITGKAITLGMVSQLEYYGNGILSEYMLL